ncbi:chloroplast-targeted copper chaperone protein [Artemisia annua]|uniref:Chloroplast-targeted copper chaperone protein n=1 Tax=Artemisia annua TaxID=35608 RepID=A0A2U1NZP9_ARTAN|nr:chloroplast-targeted copper chaperone protein [Artemisia annua]
MKTIDIFCASQAATTTMDSNTPSSSSSGSGGRAIDRHNPIIQDQKRLTKTPLTPPSPNNKTTKTSKNNTNDQKRKSTSFADENENKHDHQQIVLTNNNKNVSKKQGAGGVLLGWGCTKPSGFISPATSSRFLLADKSLSDQFDPLLKKHVLPPQQPPLVQLEKTRKSFSDRFFKNRNDHVSQSALPVINNVDAYKRKDEVVMQPVLPVINVVSKKKDEGGRHLPSSPALTTPRSSSSLSSRSSEQQEVVLRVSLHCRGCEKKMRKHISKMEGMQKKNYT